MLYVIWSERTNGGVRINRVEASVDNLDDALGLWIRYSELGLVPYIDIFHSGRRNDNDKESNVGREYSAGRI